MMGWIITAIIVWLLLSLILPIVVWIQVGQFRKEINTLTKKQSQLIQRLALYERNANRGYGAINPDVANRAATTPRTTNQNTATPTTELPATQASNTHHTPPVTPLSSEHAAPASKVRPPFNPNLEQTPQSKSGTTTSAATPSQPARTNTNTAYPAATAAHSRNIHSANATSNASRSTRHNPMPNTLLEPDEQSMGVVTSVLHSIKQWFFGGNLVVRVGVLVLLVGVVLLLRLLSSYFYIPIELKLAIIAIAGGGLAAIGYRLTPMRFAYGISLQGTGLAIVYLTVFFAYSTYQVFPSLQSFILMAILSTATVYLAIRQEALPLALLAFAGAFLAPLLTSSNTGSVVMLFSYYLLVNIAVAALANVRTWKVLNLLSVLTTFGLAYQFFGIEGLGVDGFSFISSDIDLGSSQRWQLVGLVLAHLALYIFIAIRYAQQIVAYNLANAPFSDSSQQAINHQSANHQTSNHPNSTSNILPIDTGLLFSAPILGFGLLAGLLPNSPKTLALLSFILATVYLLSAMALLRQRRAYILMIEGMLALSVGFFALIIPILLDGQWLVMGWALQGAALVWIGQRSARAWTALFGLFLQVLSVLLIMGVYFWGDAAGLLVLTTTAITSLFSVFMLRAENAPHLVNTASSFFDIYPEATFSSELSASSDNSSDYSSENKNINHTDANIKKKIMSSSSYRLLWGAGSYFWHMILLIASSAWALVVFAELFYPWLGSHYHGLADYLSMFCLSLFALLLLYYVLCRYGSWYAARALVMVCGLPVFELFLVMQLPYGFDVSYGDVARGWDGVAWLIYGLLMAGWFVLGQAWIKYAYDEHHHNLESQNLERQSRTNKKAQVTSSQVRYNAVLWLATGLLLLLLNLNQLLPDTPSANEGVIIILAAVSALLFGLWLVHRYSGYAQLAKTWYWFDLPYALHRLSFIACPVLLIWLFIQNYVSDGVVASLPYLPILSIFDITMLLILAYTAWLIILNQSTSAYQSVIRGKVPNALNATMFSPNRQGRWLLLVGLAGFWFVTSMLVRTLHSSILTPLWTEGAWHNPIVQTALTILWTAFALVATLIASKKGLRLFWFFGIGLLGVVVLKLVIIDLAQTGAIWRVVSFIGAGLLTLVIGYIAPLPPELTEDD